MKKIMIFLLSFCVFLAVPAKCYASGFDEEKVSAKSAILMCMDTGDILYEKNADERRSPASVTKILSILLIAEAIDNGKISLGDTVTASENAMSKGGSQIWLEVGEQMTVEELLKATIIASANDACTALGEYIAGSETAFVKMMNDRAKELGLKDTNFENCTGLDDAIKNHYSSAHDLAVIACEVMKHDIVKKYTTVWLDSLRNGETELNNTNKLVNTYDGITGLKTGTTEAAGFCLCATACRDGMNLVAVVLGAKTSEERFSSATYLLDTGFANYGVYSTEPDLRKITAVTVKGGDKKSVVPVLSGNQKILCEKGKNSFTYEYKINKEVSAPIKKGDVLGEINVMADGKKIAVLSVISPENINKTTFAGVFVQFLRTF